MSKTAIKFNLRDTSRRDRVNKTIIGNISSAAKSAIYENLSLFLYEDVDPLVPREVNPRVSKIGTTRELSSNGKITVTNNTPTNYEVFVHFGSDIISKKYARRQHENLEFNHSIGQANFLKDPFDDFYPVLVDYVQDAIKDVL